MARSLGLAGLGEVLTPSNLLARFALDRLPLAPTVWSPEQVQTTPLRLTTAPVPADSED
jgi:hypothetical protein